MLGRGHRVDRRIGVGLALVALALAAGCARPGLEVPALEWQALNDGLAHRAIVLSLAVDPDDPRAVYAGTYDPPGLYRSGDGGETWARVASPMGGQPAYVLWLDGDPGGALLAGTTGGLYRTRDGGQSWEHLLDLSPRRAGSQPLDQGIEPATAYALAREASGTLYLGGDGTQVVRSDDGGEDWEPLQPLPAGTAVLSLAVTPDGGLLLAGTDGEGLFLSRDGGGSWQAVEEVGAAYVAGLWVMGDAGQIAFARTRRDLLRTMDGGHTWEAVVENVEGRVDTLAIDPAGGELLLATDSGRVYRGTVDGEHWTPWGKGFGRQETVFALQPVPGREGMFYAGTRSGLFRSDDAAIGWHRLTQGPGTPAASSLALASDGTLYLGNPDGVYHSTDLGEHWEWRGEGLPEAPVLSVAPAPADSHLLYASVEGHGLYRSIDGGQTWAAHGPSAPNLSGLVPHPTDPQWLYGHVPYQRVYESRDGGVTWHSRWQGMDRTIELLSLTVDARRPGILYAGGTETLFGSQDGALSWAPIGPELEGQTVLEVIMDPEDPERLYAGATQGAYYSRDGGESWARWGRGLEDVTVTALVIHPERTGLVYAGTKYRGIYRSDDGGDSWQWASDGLGPASVSDLYVSPDGHWLLAATSQGFYRGVAR